jgi:dihydrofolate synthase/folylpolyglutamate synthase
VIVRRAGEVGAPLHVAGQDWVASEERGRLVYQDEQGLLDLPSPRLFGRHQIDNAGIAIAALRAAGLAIPAVAFAAGVGRADWPARMQRLHGKLAALLPPSWELWLDGGHNPGAGLALAEHLRGWADRPAHVVVGLNQAKDGAGFLRPIVPLVTTLWAVSEADQHASMTVEGVIAASGGAARPAPTVIEALRAMPRQGPPARVLICGSLYLAGSVLTADVGLMDGLL